MPVAKIMNRGTLQGGEHLAVVASFPVKLMQHVSHIFILSKEQENKAETKQMRQIGKQVVGLREMHVITKLTATEETSHIVHELTCSI